MPNLPKLKLLRSIQLLSDMHGLDVNDMITDQGRMMAFIPLYLMLSNMILASTSLSVKRKLLRYFILYI